MKQGYKLITVITNGGYVEDIAAIARKAGASGGTILSARGTGTADDVQFLGITLAPEKDVLLIVAENNAVDNILTAINSIPELNVPGSGVIYTTDVDRFMVLGKS